MIGFWRAATFEVKDGRQITVWPFPGVDPTQLNLHLLGSVMALLLWQRGHFVLHASSVAIDGRVAAFIGESGAGKSSVAASLHSLAHPLIADDLTALSRKDHGYQAIPAFPRLRLFGATADELGYATDGSLVAGEDKVALPARPFQDRPLPLGAIYVLGRNAESDIQPVPPRDKMVELLRHSYPTRLMHSPGAEHFQSCSLAAGSIPIFRLRTAPQLSGLNRLRNRVEEHFRSVR